MLKDLKRRNARKEHQREVKGAAFIDNDPLLSAAAKSAFELAETNADDTAIAAKAAELTIEYDNGNPLSDVQMGVLCEFIQQRVDKHLELDRIEAELIDDPDKNVYYMWGQIKRRCLKGATIAWPHSKAVQYGRCSKSQVTAVMNKLMKLVLLPAYKRASVVKTLVGQQSTDGRFEERIKSQHWINAQCQLYVINLALRLTQVINQFYYIRCFSAC